MYRKRHVRHVGFGEGDDGWEVYKVDEDGFVDVLAQLQTSNLADLLIDALQLVILPRKEPIVESTNADN